MPDLTISSWSHPAVILVATDLSDTDRLMHFAFEQASGTGARLLLLHILAPGEAMAVDPVGMPYYDPAGATDFAIKNLETWCVMARSRGISCDALVREGNAAQQVLTVARQFRADRILLGTRSRGKMSKLLIGSVAEQVLRSSSLPVMTVGREARLPSASAPTEKTVLLATSLTDTSRPSAALACQIAATMDAKLVLMHVLPPMDEMERKGLPIGLDSAALRELRAIATETACGCTAPIEPRVLHGNPSIEILAEAAQRRACLIVLGATQRSVFENLTRDRTVYKVLAHARCPVLTLREPRAKTDEAVLARLAMHI